MSQCLPLAPDAVASAWVLADEVLACEGWGHVGDEGDRLFLFRDVVLREVGELLATDPLSKKGYVLELCRARWVLKLAAL